MAWKYKPIIAACCLLLAIFMIAGVIVLALIPLYIPHKASSGTTDVTKSMFQSFLSPVCFVHIDCILALSTYAIVYGTNMNTQSALKATNMDGLASGVCRFSYILSISYFCICLADGADGYSRNRCQSGSTCSTIDGKK